VPCKVHRAEKKVTNKIFKKHERRTNHKHSEPIIYVCMFDWVVSAVRVCYLTESMCSALMCACVLSLMILRHSDVIMWSNHFCFLHSTRQVNKMAPTGIYSLPFVFVYHFITSIFWNCVTVWIIFLVKKKCVWFYFTVYCLNWGEFKMSPPSLFISVCVF